MVTFDFTEFTTLSTVFRLHHQPIAQRVIDCDMGFALDGVS